MSVWERFVVRLISYLFYGLLIATAVVWLFSETLWMRTVGVFLLVFLLDRLWRLKKESASCWAIIEYALDRASIFGGNFYLWIAERTVGYDDVKNFLTKNNISHPLLRKSIKEKLNKNLDYKHSKGELLHLVESLINENDKLAPLDLYERLLEKSKDVKILNDGAISL